jgi:Mg2+ and Co2+ transporter CorA
MMKWPFVSRKQFDALLRADKLLYETHGDLVDRVDRMREDHEYEIRRLQDELHHARQAIFNTKRMQQYEEMMLQQAALSRPHPAEVVMNIMAMTDAAKAEVRKVSGIDDLILTGAFDEGVGKTKTEPPK